MINTNKRPVLKEIKNHIYHCHYQDGVTIYLHTNDEKGSILTYSGKLKWYDHLPSEAALPEERPGQMDRIKGQAWLATEVCVVTSNEKTEYCCTLCGTSLATTTGHLKSTFRKHITESHALPIIMELTNCPRELIIIPPGKNTPESIKFDAKPQF